jgi:hypothetical protein
VNVPQSPTKNEKLLSVIIPLTRMAGRMANLQKWFHESSNLPINIIVVHDIQDSLTSIELDELIRKNSHLDIKLVEGVFGSPGMARNAGLENQLATWTTFWDADDLPNPREALEAISQASTITEVIIGNFTITTSKGTTSVYHHEQIKNVALNPGLWRILIRSSTLDGMKFTAERMGEDQVFLLDLNLESKEIKYWPNFFYHYFQGDPMQLTSNQKSIDEIANTLKLASRKIKERNSLRDTVSEIIFLRLLTTTIFRARQSGKMRLILDYTPMILKINPSTLLYFVIGIRRNRAKL